MISSFKQLLVVTVLCAPFATVTAIQAEPTKPNIVVVMADDIGLGDLSYYQRQRPDSKITVQTPNIDRLIQSGMRFTDAHSPASLCAPTRFSMLTGNFSYRNHKPFGVWTPDANSGIDPKFTTSARIAKAGGYHTAFFGKWGLGSSWSKKPVDYTKLSAGALAFGFDYACELPEGIQNIPFAFYENQQWMKLKPDSTMTEIDSDQTAYTHSKKHNDRGGIGDSNWDPTQAGPILANKAVDYINRQIAATPEEPFYIYYCSQAVHIPHTPVAELDGIKIAGSTASFHGDMIRELDTQVGMIVKALKKAKVYNNTLLIFTSDNGGLSWDKGMTKAGHDTSNGLRGSKGAIHEGGHRVPFVAVWPGKIAGHSKSDEPIVGHDVVATIAALAEQPISRDQVMDSVNLLPLLTGKPEGERHAYLMHQSKGAKNSGSTYALREGDWKLIMKSTVSGELEGLAPVGLFNLVSNLHEDEAKNLITNPEYETRVTTMFLRYKTLRETGVPTLTTE